MKTYIIEYRTIPGMYSQYEGTIRVRAENDTSALGKAFPLLKRQAFTGYSRALFKFTITGIEDENA